MKNSIDKLFDSWLQAHRVQPSPARPPLDFTVGQRHTHRHHHAEAHRRRVAMMAKEQFTSATGGGTISLIQSAQANSGSSTVGSQVITFPATQPGNLLVMFVATAGGAGKATVTIGSGWQQAVVLQTSDANFTGAQIWYFKNNPGMTQATVTLGANNQKVALTFTEWNGPNLNSPVDGSTANTASGNSTTPSVTTGAGIVAASDLIVAMATAMNTAGVQSFAGGFPIKLGNDVTPQNFADSTVQYGVAPAGISFGVGQMFTFNPTLGTGVPWVAAQVAFKE